MYATGTGVAQDYVKAAQWYREAAENGDPNAQYNLGTMHYHGRGVSQDSAEAARWFRKAAEQGDADALSVLDYLGSVVNGPIPSDLIAAERSQLLTPRHQPTLPNRASGQSWATVIGCQATERLVGSGGRMVQTSLCKAMPGPAPGYTKRN
jgi:hypothetical protein